MAIASLCKAFHPQYTIVFMERQGGISTGGIFPSRYKAVSAYEDNGGYVGAVVGRYANRIAEGEYFHPAGANHAPEVWRVM